MNRLLLFTVAYFTLFTLKAQFSAADVEFWVGEGADSAVFVADFQVDTVQSSFAWGYRFDDSTDARTMMEAIDFADPEFKAVFSNGFLNDVYYQNFVGLGGNPNYFGMFSIEPDSSNWTSNVGTAEVIVPGEWLGISYTDFDPALVPGTPVAATLVTYPGAPGTAGSSAIAADSNAFVGWATGYTEIQRGYVDISDTTVEAEGSNRASYGTPENALGMAEGTSADIVSLGDHGAITLTFEHPIRDGEGFDFAVFENSFSDTYLELAFVEVSSDGNRFVRFPAVSLTQTEEQTGGFADTDPTMIHNLAGKYRQGFGTPFDLEELADSAGLNIDAITHVRLIDVVGAVDPQFATTDTEGRVINDPFPTPYATGGFDLDAVGVIHQNLATAMSPQVAESASSVYPNPAVSAVSISAEAPISAVEFYTIDGRLQRTVAGNNDVTLTIDNLALEQGNYVVKIVTTAGVNTRQLIVK